MNELLPKVKEIKQLIANPDRFCKNALALDAEGKMMFPSPINRNECAQFCIRGATMAVVGEGGTEMKTIDEMLGIIALDMFPAELADSANYYLPCNAHIHVNNHLGHDAVMDLLDKAISNLESGL